MLAAMPDNEKHTFLLTTPNESVVWKLWQPEKAEVFVKVKPEQTLEVTILGNSH